MAANEAHTDLVQQLEVGIFTTDDMTLATTLMCSDYPGVDLFQVKAPGELLMNGKPKCYFVLSVDDGAESTVIDAINALADDSLGVSNTKEYDRCKRQLVDGMRLARAELMQRQRS